MLEATSRSRSRSRRPTASTARADTDLTGTLAAYRGRGLARFAKTDSLRRLRELGIHTVATANDATNEPMLALNESLGFREVASGPGTCA